MGLFLSPLLLAKLGWRGLFFVFGALGLPLLAAWLAIVPKPPQLVGVKKAEAPSVEPVLKTALSPVPGEVSLPKPASHLRLMSSAQASGKPGLLCKSPAVAEALIQ